MGGGKRSPGGGKRALGLVGKGKPGGIITRGNGEITGGKGTTKVNTARTGVESVTNLPIVGAETGVEAATTFLGGKGTPGTASTVQIHGGGLRGVEDRLAGRGGSDGEKTRDKKRTRGRGWGM